VAVNTFRLVEDASGCAHKFIVGPQRNIQNKKINVHVGFCDACTREVALELNEADECTGKSWLIEYSKGPHPLPRISPDEYQELLDDLFPVGEPQPGDTLIFHGKGRDKVHSVFDEMVCRVDPNKPDNISDQPIPVGDFERGDEPHTWTYTGDTGITITKASKLAPTVLFIL
jgi:hypothetical protein